MSCVTSHLSVHVFPRLCVFAVFAQETMQIIHGLPDVNGVMQLLADAAAAIDPAAAAADLTEVNLYTCALTVVYI